MYGQNGNEWRNNRGHGYHENLHTIPDFLQLAQFFIKTLISQNSSNIFVR